jgi:hypothetical protein
MIPEALQYKKNKIVLKIIQNHRYCCYSYFDRESQPQTHMLLLQMQLGNKWNAAEIIWDMIHYDVQLIGGMVYEGKSCRNAG